MLAVIAETYHNRDQLRKPARVAYSAYHQGRDPDRVYWEHPRRYLPADFLEQVGLPGQDLSRGWDDQYWQDPDQPSPLAVRPAPSGTQPGGSGPSRPGREQVPPDGGAPGLDPLQAERWREALRLMQRDLDLVTYKRYLADLVLVRYDPDSGLLTVGCREADLAWLEDRMRRRLERMLIGIWGRMVQVVFVTRPPDSGG